MKMFLVLLITAFGMMAHAGFQGYQSTTNLGLFQAIKCSAGVTCSKQNEKFVIVGSAGQSTLTAATATTITASQCGQTFYNSGAVVIKLPKGATSLLGCRITFVTMNASNFDVNPDDADRILVSTDATGDAIRNATLGNSITLQLMSATQWAPISIQGTYTDVN